MADLIDRQAAVDAIEEWGLIDGLSQGEAIEILSDHEKVPSVQPEIIACGEGEITSYFDGIIRCKDCKKNPQREMTGCPMAGMVKRSQEDYCSYAERRDDG